MNSNALAGVDSPGYDVVTIGECMLRFSPPGGKMLEQADQMYVDPAGSESNMAAALSRLGVSVAWVSALPDTQVGRWITARLETHGVDVSHVVWTDERVGVFFYEPGTPPRSSRVSPSRTSSTDCSSMEPRPRLISIDAVIVRGSLPFSMTKGSSRTVKSLDRAKAIV